MMLRPHHLLCIQKVCVCCEWFELCRDTRKGGIYGKDN